MRSVALLALACVACNSTPIKVAIFADQLGVSFGDALQLCTLESTDEFVGVPGFETPPACRRIDGVRLYDDAWSLTVRGILRFEDANPTGANCRGQRCVDLLLLDFESGTEQAVFSSPRHFDWAHATEQHVVWSDAEDDANGLCHFPEGDEDCLVDIRVFDRATGATRTITSGSLVPDRFDRAARHFAASGPEVLYQDRRHITQPSCFEAGRLIDTISCRTRLYRVDLATGQERLAASGPRPMFFPMIDDGRIAWLEPGDDSLEIWTLEGDNRVFAADVSLVDLQRAELTDDYVVLGNGAAFEVVSLATGDRRVFENVAGEIGIGNGRIAWLDGEHVQLFEPRTGVRRTMEIEL